MDNSSKPKISRRGAPPGGYPGAGRPKGKKEPQTIEREAALIEYKRKVAKHADILYNNQLHLAEGISYLFHIHTDSKGNRSKPELVTSQGMIEQYLAGELENDENEYYFITTERPDNKAIDSMLDRTFGKAAQSIDVTSDGEPITFTNVVPRPEK